MRQDITEGQRLDKHVRFYENQIQKGQPKLAHRVYQI